LTYEERTKRRDAEIESLKQAFEILDSETGTLRGIRRQ